MLESIFIIMGYGIAGIVSIVALFCWKKALSYHALWGETAKKLEIAKHKVLNLQKEIDKKQELIVKKNDLIEKYSDDLNKYKAKEKDLQVRLENLQNEYNQVIYKEQLKAQNLSKEIDILTKQLKDTENMNKELQTQLAYLKNSIDEQIQTKLQPLKDELFEWKNKFKLVEGENEHLKKEIVELKKLEEEVKKVPKLRHKIMELHHLYQTMKGLKELAEERNQNWENALKKFARWVLRNTDSKYVEQENPPLGPMVAEALEFIGEQLLYDEYSSTKHEYYSTKQEKSASVEHNHIATFSTDVNNKDKNLDNTNTYDGKSYKNSNYKEIKKTKYFNETKNKESIKSNKL